MLRILESDVGRRMSDPKIWGMNQFNIPKSIVAGDRLVWQDSNLTGADPTTGRSVSYTPGPYTLSWSFRCGSISLDAVAVADGVAFATTLPSSDTSLLEPGVCYWQAHVTNTTGDRLTVGVGKFLVQADLATLTDNFDGRSQLRRMLDKVNAAIEARTEGKAVDAYEIQGRNLKYTPLPDLLMLRKTLRKELALEQQAQQLAQGHNPRRRYVQFRRP
jgi:hypothetical protein